MSITYFSNAPSTDDNNSYDIRIDHQFSERQSIFGHYTDFTNRISYLMTLEWFVRRRNANESNPGKESRM